MGGDLVGRELGTLRELAGPERLALAQEAKDGEREALLRGVYPEAGVTNKGKAGYSASESIRRQAATCSALSSSRPRASSSIFGTRGSVTR